VTISSLPPFSGNFLVKARLSNGFSHKENLQAAGNGLRHNDHKYNPCDHIHPIAQNVDDDSNPDILLFYSKEQWQ
jgi:hypothetical protein